MWKRILAVVAGFVVANVVIAGTELVGSKVFPLPRGLDMKDPHALAAYVAGMPPGAVALVLFGYALGSFAGGVAATVISGRATLTPGLVVGAFVTAGGVLNLVQIPHPLWLALASLAMYLPFAWLGSRALQHRDPGDAPA